MNDNDNDVSYDVAVDDQILRCEIVEAQRTQRPPATAVPLAPEAPSASRRPAGMIAVDCLAVFLILLLPIELICKSQLFWTTLALVAAIGLTVYWKLVAWVLTAMGPPDKPHVIAIIKAPERIFCPRCGDDKTDNYCSACGINVENEYRKMVRALAYYMVHDTKEQRDFLADSLQGELARLGREYEERLKKALESMERNYVMQIVRQAKMLRHYQQQLLEPT